MRSRPSANDHWVGRELIEGRVTLLESQKGLMKDVALKLSESLSRLLQDVLRLTAID